MAQQVMRPSDQVTPEYPHVPRPHSHQEGPFIPLALQETSSSGLLVLSATQTEVTSSTSTPSVLSTLTAPPSKPFHFGVPHDQSQSRFLLTPQELLNLILQAFYDGHKQVEAKQSTHNGISVIKDRDVNSVQLTCGKLESDTRAMRPHATWKLHIDCSAINRMPLNAVLSHPALQGILVNITNNTVDGLKSGDSDLRSATKGEWTPAVLAMLPNVKCISLTFTDDAATYLGGGSRRSHLAAEIRLQMRLGICDSKYSWPVKKLGLKTLAQVIASAQRNDLNVYLLSRKIIRAQRDSEDQDTMKFCILHDKIKTIARDECLADTDMPWEMLPAMAGERELQYSYCSLAGSEVKPLEELD